MTTLNRIDRRQLLFHLSGKKIGLHPQNPRQLSLKPLTKNGTDFEIPTPLWKRVGIAIATFDGILFSHYHRKAPLEAKIFGHK